VTKLASGETLALPLQPGRHAWLQMAKGGATLNGVALHQGDGAAISDEGSLSLTATEEAEVLFFDLA
jgi:redox-sensitive bicupin YhaK (pirin superfamily)